MSEEKKPKPKKEPEEEQDERVPRSMDGEASAVFEILVPRVVLVTDRQEYVKGQLVDLSHLPWDSIKKKIQQGVYRTASGKPANVPAKTYPPCRNC